MQRLVDAVLDTWAGDDRRRPMLIRGARQVGKTYAVAALGERRFADVASINLEQEPRYRRCFDTLQPQVILDEIGILRGRPVEPGRTLLFIDEIQACPAAVMALRYFYEQMPDLHVVGAGSLLEFALEAEQLRMPVGRIQPLFMHPLSFAEFLAAVDEEPALHASRAHSVVLSEAVHEHLGALLRTYLLLGGMPAVVAEYLETGSVARAIHVQTAITETFRDDFGKYARVTSHRHLDRVFLHAARLVGRKFMYAKVDPDSRSRDLRSAVELLERAGVVRRVCSTSGAGLPLGAEADDRHFKLVMVDVGLMQNLCGATEQLLDGDPMRINHGAVAEQFVGQELLSHRGPYERPELFYWHRQRKSSSAEVDYLTAAGGQVIPVEVKAGKVGRLRSLAVFVERYRPPVAVRVYAGGFRRDGGILSVPLYSLERMSSLLAEAVKPLRAGAPPSLP
ncbi:MAG: ATP-binding protein [Spirochaetaceae bacterium]|nr:ATP-binding protein [Spirochaetaceae bacterium]